MIDRLKSAIDKVRENQGLAGDAPMAGRAASNGRASARPTAAPELWNSLEELTLDPGHLERERVVTLDKTDQAHVSFDLLRTRLLKILRENGWSRIAITSPTKGCGKTVVSTNLALSMSRQSDLNTLMFDFDLRTPRVGKCLGISKHQSISRFLRGQIPHEKYLLRVRKNLALGLNSDPVRDSAELCQDDKTTETLNKTMRALRPDVVIFDLPPALIGDDVIAFLNNVDCVLLVVGAGQTTVAQIEDCERMLSDSGKFIGVLLNKCEQDAYEEYGYEYG